ncbi:MAG: hypothetical protein JHC33_01860 [Ignisphaera sp.]|nr:hypothetical protein [Ignisphaera sp.]
MAWRMETASGLRLYACDSRIRMGQTASIQFLDPYEQVHEDCKLVEILFESKTLVKSCRLNNTRLHSAFERSHIVPGSLFLHEVDAESIAAMPAVYVVKKDNVEEILANPWRLL